MSELSLQKKAKRLRVYVGEADRWRGASLDEAILEALRTHGIAGGTIFRALAGFGAHSRIHTTRIEVLSTDLPLVIEAVDSDEKINAVLDVIYPMVREGLITIEDVEIVKYTHRYLNPLPVDRLVSEVMTRNVVTISPEMPVQAAWMTMLSHRVKATPVVDSGRKVVGILTDEDLLNRAGIQERLSVALRMESAEVARQLQDLDQIPLKVQDVMTQPVITILDTDTLGTATSKMIRHGLKRLPVVNSQEKLVGILSRLDILRQVAKVEEPIPTPHLHTSAVLHVEDIMSSEIPMVGQDDPLGIIIEKFSKTESHRLIVVDDSGKAVGLISDSDVVARVNPEKRSGILDALRSLGKPPAGKETARDLMSPVPLTAQPGELVVDALKRMLSEERKWMVVVNAEDKPLGLVDRQIMLESILETPDRD